jgi:hypothetical protein
MKHMKLTLVHACLITLAATLSLPARAAASPVTITASFNTYTSWTLDPALRPSKANGTALIDGGGPAVGNNGLFDYFLSQPIALGGVTRVDFAYDDPPNLTNTIEFTGVTDLDVAVGQIFNFGIFTFTNGLWFPQADIDFTLTTHSTNLALDNHSFSGTLRIVSVSDSEEPFAEADYFYVTGPSGLALGSCRVFDQAFQPPSNPGNVGICAMAGKIGSLIPTGWVAMNDAAFVNSSVTDDLATAATTVPEPGTLVLTGIGLVSAAFRKRRTRSTALLGRRTARSGSRE